MLEELALPDWMDGCVKGRSAHSNANVHRNQRNLAKVDVKRFFPSVTHRMVYAAFVRAGFGPEPARLLTRIATRGGHLPQGAPTSDRLANLHLATAALALEAIFQTHDLKASAYVDDIAFSGEETRQAIPKVIRALSAIGLAVGHGKCGNAGARSAHELTGYNTNSPYGPTLRRKERSRIRAAVHHLIVAKRKPIASFQMIEDLLAKMISNITACQCMVTRMAQLYEEGKLTDAHASVAKAFCTAKSRETVAWAREIWRQRHLRGLRCRPLLRRWHRCSSPGSSSCLKRTGRRSRPS